MIRLLILLGISLATESIQLPATHPEVTERDLAVFRAVIRAGLIPSWMNARRRCTSRPSLVLFWYTFYTLMDFEFDPAKSAANLEKHGIDFIAAQALWSEPDRLEIPARSLDEPRAQVIGQIGDVVWSAFITMRGDRIRIISVRRARDEEKAAYLQD